MLLDELLLNQRDFETQTKLSIDDFLLDPKLNSALNVRFVKSILENFLYGFFKRINVLEKDLLRASFKSREVHHRQ